LTVDIVYSVVLTLCRDCLTIDEFIADRQ